ncbi:hypothetical protein EDB85DRAFT_1928163 [Lactarius pseudohatsudake]|nr:hypothetical protein EDB85DRAFT_2024584 [Lactarius pseudohatsudake]KAH9038206.1 hypothetical protein EDB85DRAFT_1934023 [Lactarius pseudohatsudake]KAH9039856.1 hypothetical protein EDB85DRAFT_1928163 [Lactarius pseudohatsudake]
MVTVTQVRAVASLTHPPPSHRHDIASLMDIGHCCKFPYNQFVGPLKAGCVSLCLMRHAISAYPLLVHSLCTAFIVIDHLGRIALCSGKGMMHRTIDNVCFTTRIGYPYLTDSATQSASCSIVLVFSYPNSLIPSSLPCLFPLYLYLTGPYIGSYTNFLFCSV